MYVTMDLCRVCLATVADGIQTATLFSTTYQTLNLCDMLSACTALPLDPDDGMPNLICANCLTNLITAHEFRLQCYSTDAKLRDILQLPPAADSKLDGSQQQQQQQQQQQSDIDDGCTQAVDALADAIDGSIIKDEDLFDIGGGSCDSTDGGAEDVELEDGEMFEVESIVIQSEEHIVCDEENYGQLLEEQKDIKFNAKDANDADDNNVANIEDDDDDDDEDDNIPLKRLRQSPGSGRLASVRTTTPNRAPSLATPKKKTANAVRSPPDAAAAINVASFRVQLPATEFPCTVCHLVFTKQFRLNAHMNTHAVSKKYYECDKCKVRFPNEHALARHRIKHDQTIAEPLLQRDDAFWTRFECTLCPSKFNTREALADHQHDHDPIETIPSGQAAAAELANGTTAVGDGEGDADDVATGAGAGQRTDAGRFLCEHCPRVFASRTVLHRHIRSHTGAQQYQCDQCERSFVREELLVKHMLRHDTLKKYPCELCDKVFTHAGSLKSHMKSHSDMSAFLCCECGKSFGNSGNLKTHMIRHSGAKPYECAQCFARFPIKGDLYNHMKTHTGARPATCDICGSSFTRQSTLNKHKLIHVGIRPYPCEMCEMRFSSSDHVKRHMRIHTGEKPFKCEYCPRAFTQKNDLVKHTRSHIGENTYQCKQCPAAYRLYNDLKVHARTHQKTIKELMGGGGGSDAGDARGAADEEEANVVFDRAADGVNDDLDDGRDRGEELVEEEVVSTHAIETLKVERMEV